MSNVLKVGLLGVASLLLLAFFIVRIDRTRWNREKATSFSVWLPDAQGLDDKAPVLLKGVRVGRVTALDLSAEGVRAEILVTERVELREGTRASVSSVGLLGEKQLDLLPGKADAPPLEPGSVIPGKPSPSLDAVIGTIGDVGEDVKAVTSTVRRAVANEETEAKVQEVLENLVRISAQLEKAVRVNQGEITRTVEGIRRLSEAAGALATRVNELAGTHGGAVESGVDELGQVARQLRVTSDNLAQVSQRLVDGEGSLGHWVQSDETAERLDAALTSLQSTGDRLSTTLGGFPRGYVDLAVRGDYLFEQDAAKSFLQLDVSPDGKAFGRFQLVTQPFGEPNLRTTTATTDSTGETITTREQTRDALTVSAQAGYRWRPLALRMGLTESRPGVGADVLLFQDRIRMSADVWSFSRVEDWPSARLEAEVRPLENVFLMGGWNDPFSAENASLFLGAGVRFSTEKEGGRSPESPESPPPAGP